MTPSPEKTLILELGPDWIPGVSRFFQDGVLVETRLGCSVQAFLLEQLGLSPEYVEARIQTIMLNGKVVDDPAAAAIYPGAVLSLSAAMPGLLGATLRTGSYYAAMRSQISWQGGAPTSEGKEGTVVLKLFNLLINEVGPRLLRRGVRVRAEDLTSLLGEQTDWLLGKEAKAYVDGSDVDLERLSHTAWGNRPVCLKLRRPRG
jgi:hypothetical protein